MKCDIGLIRSHDFNLLTALYKVGAQRQLIFRSKWNLLNPFHYRYVKEWLGAMVAASIVDVDGVREKYYIHDGHKPAILNGVTTASILPLLSQSHDEVKRCFKKDGPQGTFYILFMEEPQKMTCR